MSKVKKIMIFGMPGSGKSTVSAVLDNHSLIYNSPHADKILPIFYDKSIMKAVDEMAHKFLSKKLEKNNILHISNYFGKSKFSINSINFLNLIYSYCDYSRTESYANCGWGPVPQYSGDQFALNFNFNFDKYHSLIKERIFSDDVKSPEEVWDIFYVTFFEVYTNKKFNYEKSISIVAPNSIEGMKFVLDNFKDTKVIFLNRDFKGLMLTSSLRRMGGWFDNSINTSIEDNIKLLIKCGYAKRLLDDMEEVNILKNKYKGQLLTLDLNDLVDKYDDNIISIANFLDIDIENSLYYASYFGYRYNNKNYDPISKIGDNADEYFDDKIHAILDSFMEKGFQYKKANLYSELRKNIGYKFLSGIYR